MSDTINKWYEFSDKTKHQVVLTEEKAYFDGQPIENLSALLKQAQERIEELKRIHEAQAHAINTITSCLGLKEWGLNEAINTILQLQKVKSEVVRKIREWANRNKHNKEYCNIVDYDDLLSLLSTIEKEG